MSKYFSWLSLFVVATMFSCKVYAEDKKATSKAEPKSIVKQLNPYVSLRFDVGDFVGWNDDDIKDWISKDKFKFNLLYFSVYNKSDKLAHYLLNRGVNPIALNGKSKFYNFYNALGYAAVANTNNDLRLNDVVDAMTRAAFKYSDLERRKGLAVALWMTIDSGNETMSKFLAQNGAESPIDNEIMPVYISAINNGDVDKLMLAIKYLHKNKDKQLLKDSLYAAAVWYKNDVVKDAMKKAGAKESLYSYLADSASNGNVIKKISSELLTISPKVKKVNMLKSFGFTPLVWALSSSSVQKVSAVKELANNSLDEEFRLKICGESYTPASYIIKCSAQKVLDKKDIVSGDIELLDYLKDNGAVMLLTPKQAMDYKKIAMINDNAKLLKMIMSCKVKLSNSDVDIHKKILAQWLMEAILLKKNKIAQMLVELDLPIKEQMDKSVMFPKDGGNNALRAAVGYLNIDFAKYLIAQGKALSLDERQIIEFIQFMGIVAKTSNNEEALKMLDVLKKYLKQLENLDK